MYPDIIAIGIPIMIACVVIEFIYDTRQKVKAFRLNASLSNISCGIFEQVTGFISKGIFLGVYVLVYENWRFLTIQDSVWVMLALITLIDFVFYFFHRLSHRSSFLWAGHVVHHEIEEFNLTVALRRSVMQEFTIIWVYIPFAFFGFSPGAFFLMFAAHNLYQFLIHTSYLPEMRTLGLIFNTPFHHEIHHCRNEAYIDKNFAGVFIIWDKLFGTFAERTEKPEFGVGHLTTTLNPIKAQLTTLMLVIAEMKRRQGFAQKMDALFGSPAYLSYEYEHPAEPGKPKPKRPYFNPQISASQMKTAVISFIVMLVAITVYRNYENDLSVVYKWVAMFLIAGILFAIGNILDGRYAAKRSEQNRSADRLDTNT